MTQPEMKSCSSFPTALELFVVGYILSDAFEKIALDGPAFGHSAKFGLDSVVPLSGEPGELGESWQIPCRVDPEHNSISRDRTLSGKCCIDLAPVVHWCLSG